MNQIDKIIKRAEGFLKDNPFDLGHDLDHHLEVWELAQEISQHIEEKADLNVLQVAVMWHDVVVGEDEKTFNQREKITHDTYIYLKNLLKSNNFSAEFIDKVINSVKFHGFNQTPQTLEGKILYDADKLSALDFKRWEKIVQAAKSGRMSPEHFNSYKKAGKIWIAEMRNRLNFEYSRKIHDEMIRALLANNEVTSTVKNFNWNLMAALPK